MFLKKLVLACSLISLSAGSFAQDKIMNMPEHDSKWYYFGITFGANMSTHKLQYAPSMATSGEFKSIQALNGPGFSMGIVGNLQFNKRWNARFIPSLTFANKSIETIDFNNEQKKYTMESIYLSLPLQLKLKSDRINNFRFYVIAGPKIDIDLASNAKSRRLDEWLKVNPYDIGFELGLGFEFFFPNFILTPEIKISQGLLDLHSRDPQIAISRQLDKIGSRMIILSFNIEG